MPVPQPTSIIPPFGYVYLGADVDSGNTAGTAEQANERWEDFVDLTDNRPAISFADSYSVGWLPFYLQNIAIPRGATSYIWWRPVTFSLVENKITTLNIKEMSKGTNIAGFSTDKLILEQAASLAALNQRMLLAPAPEPNHHETLWSAFNEDGSARNWTPSDYRNLFRRIVILSRGGTVAQINSRLLEWNLDPLETNWTSTVIPNPATPGATYPNASLLNFVFVAREKSDRPENHWTEYYPGDEFVQWVGQSVYENDFNIFDNLDAFYDEYCVGRNKPYILSPWTLESDNAFFVDSLFYWVQSRDYVQGMVFRNSPNKLEDFPDSLNRYKVRVRDSRFVDVIYTNQHLDPWGWVSSPAAGETLKGTVGITVKSYDDQFISKIEFFVDGQKRFTDRAYPSTFWWNTNKEENGFHRIGVVQYDTEDNESSVYEVTYRTEN
jgi:hypothetical protein